MKRIILASLIFSCIAFAVSATKFYCDINMQNHKVTNLASPSADADAVNKAYVDAHIGDDDNPHSVTKAQVGLGNVANVSALPLAGGLMNGAITMPSSFSPVSEHHVATKGYVDSKSSADNYDYFALKHSSGYKPAYHFPLGSSSQNFKVVLLKSFTGAITTYVEGADAVCHKMWASQTWKAGQNLDLTLAFSPYAVGNTNGTIIVKSEDGTKVGNWAFTFRAAEPPVEPLAFVGGVRDVLASGTIYVPVEQSTDMNVSSYLVSAGQYDFKLTNRSSRSILATITPSAKHYGVSSFCNCLISERGSSTKYETLKNKQFAAGASMEFTIYVQDGTTPVPSGTGFRSWIGISAGDDSGSFGELYVPGVE